jgi:hypothetical protein
MSRAVEIMNVVKRRIPFAASLCAAVASAWLTGCHELRITEPQRTASEQLLLSAATDKAVQRIELPMLAGRTVYMEEKYFDSIDEGYALGALREFVSEQGALLVEKREDAEVVLEARSGALGIDSRMSLLGIPEINVPVPLAGDLATPEIALYKSQKSDSTAKFALFAYERPTGKHIHATGPLVGVSKFHHYKVLGIINWRITDVPELDPKVRKQLQRGFADE